MLEYSIVFDIIALTFDQPRADAVKRNITIVLFMLRLCLRLINVGELSLHGIAGRVLHRSNGDTCVGVSSLHGGACELSDGHQTHNVVIVVCVVLVAHVTRRHWPQLHVAVHVDHAKRAPVYNTRLATYLRKK
jgi:hypothetical protein